MSNPTHTGDRTFRKAREMVGVPRRLLRGTRLRLTHRFVKLPIHQVRNEYAFGFADAGWHYFREILAARGVDAETPAEESGFFAFFQHPRTRAVRYLNDLLFMHDPGLRERSADCLFYLGTYPWGEWSRSDLITGGVPYGHHYDRVENASTRDLDGYRRNPWYEPGDPHPLHIEWDQVHRVGKALSGGYRPWRYGGWPEVILLERRDGEQRAVVAEGQHRMAALGHLGYREVCVPVHESVPTIREVEVEDWFHVRSGRCSAQTALLIFNAFFEWDGRERAQYLDLRTAY